jgi:cleavage and polyadenylation specificity factor subunit 3
MYFIEIAGVKVLFTGDYSREDDRMLIPAEIPPEKPDILICESTFGTASHEPRPEKEARLTSNPPHLTNKIPCIKSSLVAEEY